MPNSDSRRAPLAPGATLPPAGTQNAVDKRLTGPEQQPAAVASAGAAGALIINSGEKS